MPPSACPGVTGSSLTITGRWTRSDGEPHENRSITACYYVSQAAALTPNYWFYNPGAAGGDGGTQYCKTGDLQATTVTTDCDGNYTFNLPNSVMSVSIAPGIVEVNSSYDPTTDNNDLHALIVNDPSSTYQGPGSITYSGTLTGVHGSWPFPYEFVDRFFGSGRCTACAGADSNNGNQGRGGAPAFISQVGDFQAITSNDSGGGTLAIIGGSYTLDMVGGSHPGITSVVLYGGIYYYWSGVNVTVTDACATTETVTCGAGSTGLAVVDGSQLTAVAINSGAPTVASVQARLMAHTLPAVPFNNLANAGTYHLYSGTPDDVSARNLYNFVPIGIILFGVSDTGDNVIETTVVSWKRGYHIAWSRGDGQIFHKRAWHAEDAIDFQSIVDAISDGAEPRLSVNPNTGLLSLTYRRGNDTDGWDTWRRYSWDYGATWKFDPDDGSTPYMAGIKHAREVFTKTPERRLVIYNDASGTAGAGLLQVKRYDPNDVADPGNPYPAGGGGIGGVTCDDASFGGEYCHTANRAIDVVFPVSGVLTRYRTYDDGKTWIEVPIT